MPTGKLVGAPNDPVPLPKSIETLLEALLATAKSKNVSPLKSPTATEDGAVPTAKLVAVPNDPVPVPKSIETLLEPSLATAISKNVSPLKKPTATEVGVVPTAKLVAVPNNPVPLPKSIETLSEPKPRLDTARSKNVSPLKSPTATEVGADPTAKLVAVPNNPVPLPKSIETLLEPSLATAKSKMYRC